MLRSQLEVVRIEAALDKGGSSRGRLHDSARYSTRRQKDDTAALIIL